MWEKGNNMHRAKIRRGTLQSTILTMKSSQGIDAENEDETKVTEGGDHRHTICGEPGKAFGSPVIKIEPVWVSKK